MHRSGVTRVEQIEPTVSTPNSGTRTQLHYSTPGGTRIIWTFDPAFQLKEARR